MIKKQDLYDFILENRENDREKLVMHLDDIEFKNMDYTLFTKNELLYLYKLLNNGYEIKGNYNKVKIWNEIVETFLQIKRSVGLQRTLAR